MEGTYPIMAQKMDTTMQNKIIAITGVSSIGKTDIAFTLANKINASVICGDKVQIIAGYRRITGASDHEKYTCGAFLYGSSKERMQREVWQKTASCIIREIGGRFIIDGLAWFYMQQAINMNAKIFRLNVNIAMLEELFNSRLDAAINNGLLDEVKRGEYDKNLIKESSVAEYLSMHTRGEISLFDAREMLIKDSLKKAELKIKDSNNFAANFIEIDHDPMDKEKTMLQILDHLNYKA